MAAKPMFTPVQTRILKEAARRVRKRFKSHEEMGLAVGLSPQSISAILKGSYTPSERYAKEIAVLDGRPLIDLIGPYSERIAAEALGMDPPKSNHTISVEGFANLDLCIGFYRADKTWKPWTVAAARAGIFGDTDFSPPQWHDKLDQLEANLERTLKR